MDTRLKNGFWRRTLVVFGCLLLTAANSLARESSESGVLVPLRDFSAAAAFGAMAIMILLHFRILQRIRRRLGTLVESSTKIAGGTLRQMPPIEGSEEVRRLSDAFNLMVQRLRESEEHLILLLKETEEGNRLKSEFLSNMSHEFRTPLNGIMGFTQLILDDPTISAEHREYLETVASSAESLLHVIDDVLDLSKLEAGRLDLDLGPFSLRDCVCDSVQTVRPTACEKGLELTWDVDAECPEDVIGDSRRLRQVLLNLLGNAIKFTFTGSVRVDVRAKPAAGGKWEAVFAVCDTGIGMSAATQQVIFEPFRQGDGSLSRRYGGSGLGLAISARLVETMGGNIRVVSELGRGSTFYFTARFGVTDSRARQSRVPSTTNHATSLSVVVAEGNTLSRLLTTALLEEWGHTVVLADAAPTLLELLQKERFDLILMDVDLAGMDALDAAARIREQERPTGKHVPIVAMATNGQKTGRQQCLRAGMDGYVTKPVYPKELRALITGISAKHTCDEQEVRI